MVKWYSKSGMTIKLVYVNFSSSIHCIPELMVCDILKKNIFVLPKVFEELHDKLYCHQNGKDNKILKEYYLLYVT